MSARSRLLGQLRLLALYAAIALLVYLSRPAPALVASGAVLAALGEAMRLWSAGHLIKSVRLITSGPYAHTQNPLYLGRLLILTGIVLAARVDFRLNLAVLALAYAGFFFYYMPRKIRVEGGRLRERHGAEFEAYHRSVPILFPSIRRYPSASRDPWSLRQTLRSGEPNVVLGLILVFAVLAWKAARF